MLNGKTSSFITFAVCCGLVPCIFYIHQFADSIYWMKARAHTHTQSFTQFRIQNAVVATATTEFFFFYLQWHFIKCY